MEVVHLYQSNYRDIPKTLRVIADEIEKGDFGPLKSAAVILEREDGTVEVFGLGDAEYLRTLGLLQLGQAYLAKMKVK